MFPFYNCYFFPPGNDVPPTIYSILNSLLNFDKEEKVKTVDLAKEGHSLIFDFTYPLTEKINKDEFETLILNKFLMRRIGYETMTAFKIALNVKLNEIMPTYNKMFDFLDGWNLFLDGEIEIRSVKDTNTNTSDTTITNTAISNSTTNNKNKFSDLPQAELSDIDNDEYVSQYSNINNIINSSDNNNSTSDSNSTDNRTIEEMISRSPSNKMELYKQFVENRNSIYTMILKELDSLFFGVV